MVKATIPKFGAIIVTIAAFVLGITLPETTWIDENRAVYVSIVALISLLIGIALWVIGIKVTKSKTEEPSPLHTIVPTLEKMDSLLGIQALREAKKKININKYIEVNNRMNTEILGIKTSSINTPEEAKAEVGKVKVKITKKFKGKDRKLLLKIVGLMGNALDGSGFGLKAFRSKGKYKQFMQDLTTYRNVVIDEQLNELIREHIEVSETFNNMLLAKERAINMKANYQGNKYGLGDITDLSLVATIGGIEQEKREQMINTRVLIGKRIDELEAKKK